MSVSVNQQWDRRMRWVGRSAAVVLIALYLPVVVGAPVLFALTVPAAAIAVWRLHSDRRIVFVTGGHVDRARRSPAMVVAVAAALFVVGLVIDGLPSDDLHDRYWALFVAPMMIGIMVEIVAVPMLVWSWFPRRTSQ